MNAMRATDYSSTFDVEFPLQPTTKSAEDVSHLVDNILHSIGTYAENGRHVSQSDVLQALAIATAVHAAKADATQKTGEEFALELLDVAVCSPHAEPRKAKLS